MSEELKEVRIPFPNPIQDRFQVLSGPENPNAGNGRHFYQIVERDTQAPILAIQFQNGALNEPDAKINGVLTTCLLAVLVDHLKSFQAGPYSSRETAIMITHLEDAQNWAARRQDDRASRGVQGKHQK